MPPLPKRRHSTQRSGMRQSQDAISLPNVVACAACGKPRLPHKACKSCGAYKPSSK